MPLNASQLESLRIWFEARNLPLDKDLITRIANYQDLIHSWSGRINLVSKGDRSAIVENHILDSLGPHELIPKQSLLIDIGTGAGFPGIPLALFRPEIRITLVESVHKKILFLRVAKDELGLENVEIIEGRFEELEFQTKFDIATLRALPRWESYIGKIEKIVKTGGKIIYYKQRGAYTTIIV
jgi:16S rRNA (guanine527-N7)-methyltransferase